MPFDRPVAQILATSFTLVSMGLIFVISSPETMIK